jgi:hypothetical protein
MIRIDRGPEPEALVLARDEHLARARLRGSHPDEIHGYDAARDVLTERQIYKCAYCELTLRDEASPVEHYRPKARVHDVDWASLVAKKKPTETDREDDERFARGLPPSHDGFDRIRWIPRLGYWWLAWTWENLVFGCTGCNSGVKLTRFPQAKGASALRALEAPPSEEHPLLLDPADADEDPLDHIQFRWVYNRWKPVPREGSPRGAWTIALLRLDSNQGLLTAYENRVRHLNRCVRTLDAARESSGEHAIRTEWEAVRHEVLDPKEPLLGLTYDWLDARYTESWRADLGLVLDKPVLRVHGFGPAVPARPAVTPLPELDGLPEPLGDLIRVARNFRVKPSPEQKPLRDIVADILVHRPHATDQQLAALLNRKPGTIRKCRK